MMKSFLKLVRFKDSRNGRIAGLIFFNIIPLLPLIFIVAKEIINVYKNNIQYILDEIKGEK